MCSDWFQDLAHIEPSGMGGRQNRTADNLVGLCRHHHRVFDGQDLGGRQRMLRDLMKMAKLAKRRDKTWKRIAHRNVGGVGID